MNKTSKDPYSVPPEDIQEKITELMGPTPEDALPTKQTEERSDDSDIEVAQKDQSEKELAKPASSNDVPEEDKKTDVKKPVGDLADSAKQEQDDRAVEDIIRAESDSLLQAEDAHQHTMSEPEKRHKHPLKRFFRAWWGNKVYRNSTLAVILVIIVALATVPTSRYATLNAIGVRASVSMSVIDGVSGKSLKNVDVKIGNAQAMTNEDGHVQISGVRLGSAVIEISKRSFEKRDIPITIGWGSNPIVAPYEMIPSGTTFPFTVRDWLSNTPIRGAEITDGESTAISNDDGIAEFTIEPTDDDTKVIVSAEGYRNEEAVIPSDSTDAQTIQLVPNQKDIFISNRSGKYDVYSRYADGKDETVLLPGTGTEQRDIHVLPNDNGETAALVSSRDGKRNKDGYILSNMYIISIATKQVEKVANTEAESIRLIGWSGDDVLFLMSKAGPSYYGNRQHLVVYNTSSKQQKQLGFGNYFNDIKLIGNQVFYATTTGGGGDTKGLYVVNMDGSNKKNLIKNDSWSISRNDKNSLIISGANGLWYKIAIDTSEVEQLDGEPATLLDKRYISNDKNTYTAWAEERDGKSVILLSNNNDTKAKPKELVRISTIATPQIRWLNDTSVLYTLRNTNEHAHYIISTLGGDPVIIGDVGNPNSASFYYY